MKPVTWILLLCLVIGVFVAVKIALRLLLFFLPLCAAIAVAILAYRALNRKSRT